MDKERLIENLEGEVKKRTANYIPLNRSEQGNKKLLKSHILLSKLYSEKGKEGKASQHYHSAVQELENVSKTELSNFNYFSGRIFKDFEEFDERLMKTENELRHYKKKLGKLAEDLEIGMEDQINLAYVPVTIGGNKPRINIPPEYELEKIVSNHDKILENILGSKK